CLFMKVTFTQKNQNFFWRQRKFRAIPPFVFSVLLLAFFSFNSYAQNNVLIKGRITNQNGEPLAGASIVVKGGSKGINTNDNGTFEITAPANGTLVISSVGFTSREVKVNNQTSLNVTLASVGKEMEQ